LVLSSVWNVRHTFDPLVNANCPNKTQSQPYTDRSFLSDRAPVRTVEVEEMSHEPYQNNILYEYNKDQLALTDDQIKGRKTNLIESYEVTLSSPIGENKPANFSLTSVKPMI
jgi:hypothetical protein